MKQVKTERMLQILIVISLAVLVFAIYDGFTEKIVGIGDKAPHFSITTDNGRTITANDFGGKLLVLNFWATWCPPCIQEIPSLSALQQQFGPNGLVVLGVSVDQNAQAYHAFLKRANVSFLTARDPDGGISADYGTSKYPETYIIDSEGRVVQKIIGAADWTDASIVNQIKMLL